MNIEHANMHAKAIANAYFDNNAIEHCAQEFLERQRTNPTLLMPREHCSVVAALNTLRMPAHDNWQWRVKWLPTQAEEWHDPHKIIVFLEESNTIPNARDMVLKALDHFTTRIAMKILQERDNAANDAVCDECKGYFDQIAPPMNFNEYNRLLLEATRKVIERTDFKAFIETRLFKPSNDTQKIISSIVGRDKSAINDAYLNELVEQSADAFTDLLMTNPGIAGAWIFLARCANYTKSIEVSRSPMWRIHNQKNNIEALRHPGQAVSLVSRKTGIKTGTFEWKMIAAFDAKVVYQDLLKLRRARDRNGDIALAAYGHAKKIMAIVGVKTSATLFETIGRVLRDIDMHTDAFYPALAAYCREAVKGKKVSQKEMKDELTNVLDYVSGTLGDHERALQATGAQSVRELAKVNALAEAQRKKTWGALCKASAKWHADEAAMEQAQDDAENKRFYRKIYAVWESLVPQYADGEFVCTALVDEMDLIRHGNKVRNCLRSIHSRYSTSCMKGYTQIYSVERVIQNNAGEKRKTIGTILLSNWDNQWEVKTVERAGYGVCSPKVKNIAQDLARTYTEACRQQTD